MCGIFLVISKKKLLKKKCLNALNLLKKRGPDTYKFEFFNNDQIFLCNTILNITGKLDKKSNLIKSSNERFKISFNGEIYNYKEISKKHLNKTPLANQSDTQILADLHEVLKGKKIPKILNGMFAYVIYDVLKNKIIIANDPQGEKNLYIFKSKNEIIISSNVSSILMYKKNIKISYQELKNYFSTRHLMPFNETCYKNIRVLDSATYINIDIENFSCKETNSENPLDWIDKKKYLINSKLNEKKITKKFEKLLLDQAKLMIPSTKFGCIFSGGIDSSLQTSLINSIKRPNAIGVLHYKNKDKITENISNFQKFFKVKINRISISTKEYLKDLIEVYKTSKLPIYTHSVVGIHQISKFFKKKNCKVYFSADGCDELFGGYELYKKIDWLDDRKSISPYSQSKIDILKDLNTKNYKYKKKFDNFRKKVKKKFSFIKDKKEINIQTNLFCDYFTQSIKVGNACNDLVGSENSIEVRNIFIQKNIIKEIINVPSKFKIDFKRNDYQLKIILKNLFKKRFGEKNIFPKQGFSGYPNEIKYYTNLKYNFIKKLVGKSFFKRYKSSRDFEWKFINLELFKKHV